MNIHFLLWPDLLWADYATPAGSGPGFSRIPPCYGYDDDEQYHEYGATIPLILWSQLSCMPQTGHPR